jgi:hypothetical protein
MELRWTSSTTQEVRGCLVVPDTELPPYTDILFGNDTVRGLSKSEVTDTASGTAKLVFPHDAESVPLLFKWPDIQRVCQEKLGASTMTVMEELPVRMAVTAAQKYIVPARTERMIAGRLETATQGTPEHDMNIVFFPDEHRVMMATMCAVIGGNNPEPWVPIKVCNNTDTDVVIRDGEPIGVAHSDAEVIAMVSSGGQREKFNDKTKPIQARGISRDKEFQRVSRIRGTTRPANTETIPPMSEAFKRSTDEPDGDEEMLEGFEEAISMSGIHLTSAGPGYMVGGGETDPENAQMYADRDEKERVDMLAQFDAMIASTETRLKEAGVDEAQVERAIGVLRRSKSLFVEPNEARADHPEYPFYLKIPTLTDAPVNVPAYRYPVDKLAALHEWVDAQLQKGHIEHSTSPYNAPMVLTRKKDGRWRFAIDLRGLNAVASFDPYTLPRIPDLLDLTEGAKWFSALDLRDGYWNVLVHPGDRQKTAFTVPGKGRFQWRSTPFGYHGSGPHFQRAVEACLSGLSWREVAVYVDDILFFSSELDEHLELAEAVLGRLQLAGFTVHPGKCTFFARELPYLGHRLSAKGVQADHALVQKIKDSMSEFKSKAEVRRALGIAQFYAKFIWQFSSVVAPLSNAIRSNIREDLANLSEAQRQEMRNAAKRLVEALTNAPVLALPNYAKEFVLITDASDVGIGAVLGQEGSDGNLRPVAFWSRKLSETERKYSATEREALAIVFFLDKFRHYLLGRRFLLKTDHAALKYVFNGAAHNTKLARWALKVQEFAFDLVHIPGRENCVADALSRPAEWSPIDEWNADVQKGVYVRVSGEEGTEIIIPPERWSLPTFMMSKGEPVDLVKLQANDEVGKMVMEMIDRGARAGPTLMSQKVWRMVQEGMLQRRDGLVVHVSKGRNWQDVLCEEKIRRFAPESIRRLIYADAHDATWAGHFAVSKTIERVRNHWWWPGMGKDIKGWVDSCQDCARAGKGHRQEYGLLKSVGPMMRPFERMAIDLIDLGSVKGVRPEYPFCLTVVDYATRFALAIPLRNKESISIAQAIVDRVIAYFGPPEELLSDNAPELRDVVAQLNKVMGTNQRFTTTYHPRANGLVERFNGTFVEMMRVVLDEVKWKSWEHYAPMAQYAYNSAPQRSTGVSPFMLMFGREASTPLLERLGIRDTGKMGNEWLDNLTACRKLATETLTKIQTDQKRRFDAKRKEADFEIGDTVFLRSGSSQGLVGSKAIQRFKGPFRVHNFKAGDSVVDLTHASTGGEITRVSVERVRKVRDETVDRLSPTEMQILNDSIEKSEPLQASAENADQYELLTIHGDRMGEDGVEFLVEYRMPKGAREGMWIEAKDMEAEEMIQDYWNRKARNELIPINSWKRKCRWNGFDSGCKHLQCRAESWKEAMGGYWEKAQEESKTKPSKKAVQTKAGRVTTRVELRKGRN